jgi:basic membrane protein A
MKKFLTIALAAAASTATLATAQGALRIGMAYDAGGKFDKSFNQSAYEGGQRAVKSLGVQLKDFEPSDPSQVVQGIRSFTNEGFDLTIGVGFANEASITQVAKENPDLYFGLVDSVSPAKNVASMVFAEQEGSYLVGYLAGLNSATDVVGFVGGMDIPLIHKFEAGYTAGVKAANPRARVIAQYVGTTPDAWNNPGKAKEIAASMRAKGADIIFAAAGGSGNGVIDYIKQTQCVKPSASVKFTSNNFAGVKKSASYTKACAGNTRPMFFIGVDSNQNRLGDFDANPATLNHGLTSMLKRVDNAVYALIRDTKAGNFKGGERLFGLKEGGVGYAVDQYNKALIPSSQVARVEGVKAQIISGKIKVPTK